MRVALLYPEVYDLARFHRRRREFPPFGVLYLAAVLRESGIDVSIIRVTPGETVFDLTAFDTVGFSLASSATLGQMLSARNNSIMSDDALVMVGGVHAKLYPRESLDMFRAHVVAHGDADTTIVEIAQRKARDGFSAIPGVSWRDGSGRLQSSRQVRTTRDMSSLPPPARDLLPVEDIVMQDRLAGTALRMAHVMFSRGCPFSCAFCAAGGTRAQYRDGVSARHELLQLTDAYGIDGFAIVDDNFVVHKAAVHSICDSIADLGLKWSALSRVDTIDSDLLRAMAQSGCIEMSLGVESGSERLLRAMRKNTTRDQIRKAVLSVRDAGIQVRAFIVHGFPGEDLATTRETIALLRDLEGALARVSLFRFVPLPGTHVYAHGSGGHRVHGTHLGSDWDGDWSKFHIHHNHRHWWGTERDFRIMQAAYEELARYIEHNWGAQS